MSWSISNPTLTAGCPASQAKQLIESDQSLPDCVKSYVTAGIDGILAYFAGEAVGADPLDVPVKISGHGHLCMGPGSYNVTSATINISPAG